MTPMQKIVADRLRPEDRRDEHGVGRSPGPARHRLPLARRHAEGARVGHRRPLHPGRLRGRAGAVLRRLGAADRAALRERARLPQAPARAAFLRARRGRGAAVPAELPARRARPRLKSGGRRGERGARVQLGDREAGQPLVLLGDRAQLVRADHVLDPREAARARGPRRAAWRPRDPGCGSRARSRSWRRGGSRRSARARARDRRGSGAGSRSARARRGSPATRRSSRSGTSGARRRRAVSPARAPARQRVAVDHRVDPDLGRGADQRGHVEPAEAPVREGGQEVLEPARLAPVLALRERAAVAAGELGDEVDRLAPVAAPRGSGRRRTSGACARP